METNYSALQMCEKQIICLIWVSRDLTKTVVASGFSRKFISTNLSPDALANFLIAKVFPV